MIIHGLNYLRNSINIVSIIITNLDNDITATNLGNTFEEQNSKQLSLVVASQSDILDAIISGTAG